MTNIDEIKARAAQLNHPHPTYFSYNAEWAATTILEMCGEVERLKEIISYLPKVPTQPYEKELAKRVLDLQNELAEKDSVLEFYSNEDNIFTEWDESSGASYLQERHKVRLYDDFGTTAKEVMQKYRKSEG